MKRRTRGGGVVRCFPRRSRSRLSRRRREIAGDRSRHDRASGAESRRAVVRAAHGEIRTPRRGVLIHRLRVLVGVVPHDRQLPASPRAASSHRCAAATPNPKRLARFASTLLTLSPLFSRSSGPSASPSPRSVLLQPLPGAPAPPRHPSPRACRPCRSRRYIRTGLTRNPRDSPPTVRPAATQRTAHPPLSRPLAVPPPPYRAPAHTAATPSVLAVNVRRVTTLDPEGKGVATARYISG